MTIALLALPPAGFLYLITWVCMKSHPPLWKTWLNTLVSCPVYLWDLVYFLTVKRVSLKPCYYPIPSRQSLALSQLCWFLFHTSGPLPARGPHSQPSALTHDCQTPREAVHLSTPLWWLLPLELYCLFLTASLILWNMCLFVLTYLAFLIVLGEIIAVS